MKIESIEELVNFIGLVEKAQNSNYKFYVHTGSAMENYKGFEDFWIDKESLENYCKSVVCKDRITFGTIILELDDKYCIKEIIIKDLFIYNYFEKSYSARKTLYLVTEQTFKNILDSVIESKTKKLNTIKSEIEGIKEIEKKGPPQLNWVEKVEKEDIF